MELRNVACPQPEPRQEQDDRAITPARTWSASKVSIVNRMQEGL
jgi:hypothetical protein